MKFRYTNGASLCAWAALGATVMPAMTATAQPMVEPESASELEVKAEGASDDQPMDAPRVFVLTLGPGDHPFFKFGHNAIHVRPRTGTDGVYNFGTFGFDKPAVMIPKFLMGRFYYWLSVAPSEQSLWYYRESNRSIESQELNLSPALREKLAQSLQHNALPENREYLYDYFLDNCSTRVRDAVDGVLDGHLRALMQKRPAALTFRQHALRLTHDVMWEYVVLHFALSGANDRVLSAWEESFIPEVFQKNLRSVTVPGSMAGVADATAPLVLHERVVFAADRVPTLPLPPARGSYFLLFGALFGALAYGSARLARRSRGMRVLLGAGISLLGLVMGFLGSALLFLWWVTDHKAADANENVLLCGPWLLALVWYGIGIMRSKRAAIRRCAFVALASAALGVLNVLLKVVPGFIQDNWSFILFFVPLWLGLGLGVWRLAPGMRGTADKA